MVLDLTDREGVLVPIEGTLTGVAKGFATCPAVMPEFYRGSVADEPPRASIADGLCHAKA